MTQKERIEKLEQEIADLRLLVQALQAALNQRPAPIVLPTPVPQPNPWIQPTWPPRGPIYVSSSGVQL